MSRRSRLPRRLPSLRAARHRRERHARVVPPSEAPSLASPGGECEPDDWGAAAIELGLVAEPAPLAASLP
jgi:hypothetical protein